MTATKLDRDPPTDGLLSTRRVAELSGATMRQLDYWDRNGLITVAVPAQGSGSRRRWSVSNLEQARALALFSEGVYNDAEHGVLSRLASEVAAHPGQKIQVPLRAGLYLVYDPILLLDTETR